MLTNEPCRLDHFLPDCYEPTVFLGFRVRMQPLTTSATIAATKSPRYSCCIVVFSVA